jgi:DNA-binding MarR family transcriptional regulator
MASDRSLAECADCLCLASRRAARIVTRGYDRALRPFGLRATQFSVLVVVSMRGPITIGALAEALGSERTTLTRNLALLEREGWVQSRAGEDARERQLTVTRKGAAIAAEALPAWRQAQRKAQALLGAAAANSLKEFSHTAR